MPLISALAKTMASALQRLRQNHRRNKEVDLLCVSILEVRLHTTINRADLALSKMLSTSSENIVPNNRCV